MQAQLEKPDEYAEEILGELRREVEYEDPKNVHIFFVMKFAKQQRLIQKLFEEIDNLERKLKQGNSDSQKSDIESKEGQMKIDQIFEVTKTHNLSSLQEQSRRNSIELRKLVGLPEKCTLQDPKKKLLTLFEEYSAVKDDEDSRETIRSMRDMDE